MKWQRRERKLRARERSARMRGKRSVFEIQKAIAARYRRQKVEDGPGHRSGA